MFSGDETKRGIVIKERGIDFAKIEDIFDDPFTIDYQDYEHSTEAEIRYGVIGKTAAYGLVAAIYTVPANGEIHFITARRAEKWMANDYEKQRNRY